MRPARKPLSITEQGTTIVVRGNAHEILKAGGFRGLHNGVARGWVLDTKRLPDLCAYLDSRRIPYVVSSDGGNG